MTVLFAFNSYQHKENIKYDKIDRVHTEHRTFSTRVSTLTLLLFWLMRYIYSRKSYWVSEIAKKA